MIPRLSSFLVILFVSTLLADSAFARRLSNADVRRFGFSGVYRGEAQGFIKTKDDDKFDTRLVTQGTREILPVRNRSIVTGPSGRNGFFLTLGNISGNERRITVRMYYSGRSYNPAYEEDMIGTGTKILTIQKFNGSRPQYEMSLIDRLQERAVNGGSIFTTWDIQGRLFK